MLVSLYGIDDYIVIDYDRIEVGKCPICGSSIDESPEAKCDNCGADWVEMLEDKKAIAHAADYFKDWQSQEIDMPRPLTQAEKEELEAQDIMTDTSWRITYRTMDGKERSTNWSFIGHDVDDIRASFLESIDDVDEILKVEELPREVWRIWMETKHGDIDSFYLEFPANTHPGKVRRYVKLTQPLYRRVRSIKKLKEGDDMTDYEQQVEFLRRLRRVDEDQ